MNNCTHSRYETYMELVEDWYNGDYKQEAVREVSTYEDIDLHRYKCTKCGEIGYYSGAAHDWYVKGKPSGGIKGLG